MFSEAAKQLTRELVQTNTRNIRPLHIELWRKDKKMFVCAHQLQSVARLIFERLKDELLI